MEMLLLFACVLGLVLLNVPIAVALGAVALAAIWLVLGEGGRDHGRRAEDQQAGQEEAGEHRFTPHAGWR